MRYSLLEYNKDTKKEKTMEIDDIFELMEASNKLRKNYINCLDLNDFDGFEKHFQIFLEQNHSNETNPEVKKNNKGLTSIKEFSDLILLRKDSYNKIIDYFDKANFITQKNMLLTFWTCSDNERYFRYKNDYQTPYENFNDKHIYFWNNGITVSKKHYKTYCQVLNKMEFMKPSELFFEEQSKHLLHYKLTTKLSDKNLHSSKIKI